MTRAAARTPSQRNSKSGRTQEERSAAMRRRLLDATIECLVEYGYANTTTTKVAERAGVTRGAQVHHFPTKTDLVTAAVRYLAAKRTEQAIEELDRIRSSPDPIGDALELIWELHQGPVFYATIELWVAARTDPELREQMALVEPATAASVIELAKKFFGEHATHPQFVHNLYTVLDTVRGLLLNSFVFPEGKEMFEARWRRAKKRLRAMIESSVPEALP